MRLLVEIPDKLTADEAAARAGVSRATVFRAAGKELRPLGRGPLRFASAEVDRWAAERERVATPALVTIACAVCGAEEQRKLSLLEYRPSKSGLHFCAKHSPRARSVGQAAARADRVEEAARRYSAGESAPQIAADWGVSKTTVHNYLKRAGVARRSTSEAQTKYPPAEPRPCKRDGCEVTFTPEHGCERDRSYCSIECFRISRSSEEAKKAASQGALSQHRAVDEEIARRKAADPTLRTAGDAAEDLGVVQHVVTGRYIPDGLLTGWKEKIGGEWVWFTTSADIRRAKRDLVLDAKKNYRRAALIDPDVALHRARATGQLAALVARTGVSEGVAEAVIRETVRARASRLKKHASGRGKLIDRRVILMDIASEILRGDGENQGLGLTELEARVGLIYWQRVGAGWEDIPESADDPRCPEGSDDGGSFPRSWRKVVIARVHGLVGAELKKSLQTPTGK